MKTTELIKKIEAKPARSAWAKGVKDYAVMIIEKLEIKTITREDIANKILLNGAENWSQYSYGGCALVYDADIAETLCTPSELREVTRKDGTVRQNANSRENWLDVQARALFQANILINRCMA
ncbi:MAG: hypothetical protein IAB81_02665 [Bacteroidetes bacterium]|uniref:Uncharacterized protein n=1 Tax=Candidatus Merdivivens pullicola TaxID=2840872 RepID=A0A9D9NG23_9BACT|nr:hypothetical protein [Candidatus Merdivivens pullicola]